MNPQQVQYYNESINCCNMLLNQLERDKENIRRCFHGAPLEEYLKATDMAIERVKNIRNSLQALQSMQQQ